MVEKSYNKTVIDFNFGRHKDFYLRSKVIFTEAAIDIHLDLAASVNITFEGR